MDVLLRLFGWKATLFLGDPSTYDRWRWLSRHLKKGPVRTLDAGCGSGAYTLYASYVGNHTLGLSFDERNMRVAAARAKTLEFKNVEFKVTDLRDLGSYQGEQFDQIVCFECIEHVLNDEKLVSDLSRLLRTGGSLLMTSPFKFYHPLIGDKLSATEDGGHVRWGYTHSELKKIFARHGLRLTSKDYVSGVLTQIQMNLIRVLDMVLPHKAVWAITLPLRPLVILDRPVTHLIRYPFLSVAVTATKA